MVIAITEECMVFKLSVQKPPNKPITVALPELPPITHLAVGEGCGGTSLALQYARNALIDGGRVIWVCEKSPDSQRFSQILNDVDVVSLAKFHMMDDNVFCSCKDDILCFVVLFVHGVLCL